MRNQEALKWEQLCLTTYGRRRHWPYNKVTQLGSLFAALGMETMLNVDE